MTTLETSNPENNSPRTEMDALIEQVLLANMIHDNSNIKRAYNQFIVND